MKIESCAAEGSPRALSVLTAPHALLHKLAAKESTHPPGDAGRQPLPKNAAAGCFS